jgi:putative holliday junction resolvase
MDPRPRLLGVDPGERRIGIAVSDELGLTASPVEIINRTSLERDLARIKALASQYGVERIILGWPLTLRGEVGPAALSSQRLAERIADATEYPVELWDERLTTAEARQYQSRRDRRRGAPVDAYAAAVMLQQYLDAHR